MATSLSLAQQAGGTVAGAPAAVRDYLRLPLAGLQHEVFFALCPDAQNCLIASANLYKVISPILHTVVCDTFSRFCDWRSCEWESPR